jgi:hypothetical protein
LIPMPTAAAYMYSTAAPAGAISSSSRYP